MVRLARALVVALIAVFAAWSVAQVAGATTMSLEMATTAADDQAMNDMADCDACGSAELGDEDGLACDVSCATPVLADLATSQVSISALVAPHTATFVHNFAGRTDAPDPLPPRTLLLI